MLQLTVVTAEDYNDETEEFVSAKSFVLELEHSLVSLSKWESKHEKPFLGKDKKTAEEILSYVEMMIVDPNIPPEVLHQLSEKDIAAINTYINAKMTATWFNDRTPQRPNREVVTAEIIYYWMFSFNIPMECQHWHLNRLLTLVRVFNEKNKPEKKMSRAEAASRQRELNAQRQAALGTRG